MSDRIGCRWTASHGRGRRVAVVIPSGTPGVETVSLVAELVARGLPVLVVDDGSGAQVDGVFAALSAIDGVRILHHAIPFGNGASLKTAFRSLILERPKVEVVVTVVGDRCYRPEDILLVATAADGVPPVLVLGVRRGSGDLPFGWRLRKRLLELVFRWRTGRRLHDIQTGLRALPRELVLEALTLNSNGYEFDTALLRRGAAWGREIVEVAIETHHKERCEGERYRSWRDYWKMIRVLFGRMERK